MAKKLFLIGIILLVITCGFSQEKNKKELKEEEKTEKQNQIEAMLTAKEFVFIARTALPSGMSSVDLFSIPNFVEFHPELIESEMPFFGKAYAGIGYQSDPGLKFNGIPEEFTIEKKKKNYLINLKVKDKTDVYYLTLNVGFEGNTTLMISSTNRSSITYNGEISALEKKEKNDH